MATGLLLLLRPRQRWRRSVALAFVALGVIIVVAGSSVDDGIDAAADLVREPVRFAAGALTVPPPGALAAAPGAWPALVPNCTAAFLNASVAAVGPATTTVVRVEVPAGQAVSLTGCRTSDGGAALPMRHVRLVLAMGRSSAVALDAWDVALGGVTIEGPSGSASNVVDALVVVGGGSRIVAGTSAGTRSSSHSPGDDVHALSVVAPGPTVAVSGLGLVVMEASVVRAQHDGVGVLYASACAVRAEAAENPDDASLTVERLRVVVTGASSVEASTTRSQVGYVSLDARRAHAAAIQALPGAQVTAAWVTFAVLAGSTVSAFGDDGSSAAGGIGVSGRKRNSVVNLVTTVAVSHITLIAAGPNTTVRVATKGPGFGTSAMGVAAAHGAAATMAKASISALGPNTNVAVRVVAGGYGASAMGVAAYNTGAKASMTGVILSAVGPDTSVAVYVVEGSGFGAAAMAVAAYAAVASMSNATLHATGPITTVVVSAEGGGGYAASAMGVAAYLATASMTSVAAVAGAETTVAVRVSGRHGYAASAMGVASFEKGTASMTDVILFTTGPNTTVAVHVTSGSGYGASAMGVAARYSATAFMKNAAVYAVGLNTTVAVHIASGGGYGASAMGVASSNGADVSMTNATVYAVGPNTTVAVQITGDGHGEGASAMGIAARYGATASMTDVTLFAAGPNTTVSVRIPGIGNGVAALGAAAFQNGATASMSNTAVYAAGPDTTVTMSVAAGGIANGASAMGIGRHDGRFDATGANTITRCPGVSVAREGAITVVLFDQVSEPNVAFQAPSSCPPVPQVPDLSDLIRAPVKGVAAGTPTASSTAAASPSASPSWTAAFPAAATTRTASVAISAAASSATTPMSAAASQALTVAPPAITTAHRTATAAQRTAATSASATVPAKDEAPRGIPTSAIVVRSPVPPAASASVSVLAGVLLPSSASKPMGNARALQVADVCLSAAVGEGEALADAEPGEWPSDYAVIVARWEVGTGGGGGSEDGPAARARAAGAAVAVTCAVVAGVAAVLVFVVPRPASAPQGDEHTGLPPRLRHRSASAAWAVAVAFAVAAAYLVPNALEAAVVAATAGLGGTTGVAGAVAGLAMVAAVVPIFAAPVVTPVSAGESVAAQPVDMPPSPAAASAIPPSAPPSALLGRVAGFLHPVLVAGLRDEAAPLLRAHALLDVTVACVIAAASGATQAGVRVGGNCVLLAVVMAAAALGLTAYYALVRPFSSGLEVAVATAQAGTLAVLCGLTLAAVASNGDAVSANALELAGLAAEVVTFGAPVVLVAPVAWAWLRGGRGKHKLPRDEATEAAVPEVMMASPLLTVPAQHPDACQAPARVAMVPSRSDDRGSTPGRHVARNNNPLAGAQC